MASATKPNRLVEELAKKLQEVVACDPFKELMLVIEENSALRKENDDLKITNGQDFKIRTQLAQQLDKSAQQIAEKTSEADQYCNDIKKLKGSLTKVQNEKAEREKDLDKAAKELVQARSTIGWYRKFSIKMRKADEKVIHKQLDDLYKATYSLIQGSLGEDLGQNVLADPQKWEKIRDHPLVHRIIPLPQSNSPTAKHMRIAATLAICGDALSQHIFQSSYLLQSSNELSDVISELGESDSLREPYLRSVFLSILPEKQEENGKKRAKQAVKDVMDRIEDILPGDQQQKFRMNLGTIFLDAYEKWRLMQQLEGKVELTMYIPYTEAWKLLSASFTETWTWGENSNGHRPSDSKLSARDQPNSVSDNNAMKAVVWPAFTYREKGTEDEILLRDGFALGEGEIEAAREEELPTLLQGTHRSRRLSYRAGLLTSPIKKLDS